MLERLSETGYQFCLVDPEGDYDGLESAVRVGNVNQPPDLEQLEQILRSPKDSAWSHTRCKKGGNDPRDDKYDYEPDDARNCG